jgi:hypothetical protein
MPTVLSLHSLFTQRLDLFKRLTQSRAHLAGLSLQSSSGRRRTLSIAQNCKIVGYTKAVKQ